MTFGARTAARALMSRVTNARSARALRPIQYAEDFVIAASRNLPLARRERLPLANRRTSRAQLVAPVSHRFSPIRDGNLLPQGGFAAKSIDCSVAYEMWQ